MLHQLRFPLLELWRLKEPVLSCAPRCHVQRHQLDGRFLVDVQLPPHLREESPHTLRASSIAPTTEPREHPSIIDPNVRDPDPFELEVSIWIGVPPILLLAHLFAQPCLPLSFARLLREEGHRTPARWN